MRTLKVEKELTITSSCWFAARGTGGPKTAVEQGFRIRRNEMAHTGVVQVLVGNQPIRSKVDIEKRKQQLVVQQEHYRTKANYESAVHRLRFVDLFEQVLIRLE